MKDIKLGNLLQKISQHVPGMVYQYRLYPDGRSCFPYASEAIKDVCGFTPDQVRDDASEMFSTVRVEDLESLQKSIFESATNLDDWKHEFRINHSSGQIRWLYGFARPEKLEDGSILWHGFITDITERKNLEKELLKKNRLLSVIGKINEMIIHSQTKEDLYKNACQIAVLYGRFRMAWVGLANYETHFLDPVAQSGYELNYLYEIAPISIRDEPLGNGPSGKAFREGHTSINNQINSSPEFGPWRENAIRHGFNSSIALPLKVKGKTIGTFNIYSMEENFFSSGEVQLLEEVTRNISFAIEVLEERKEKQVAMKALAKSEYSFRTIFEEAPLGIALIDSNTGTFYNINNRYLEILGRSRSDIENGSWMLVTHPDDIQKDLDNMAMMNAKITNGFKMIKRYIRGDGAIVWVDMSIVPYDVDEKGNPRHLCMVEDITDRIRFEEGLQKAIAIKDEFFSIASHELKTPITSLKLQLQMISRSLNSENEPDISKDKLMKSLDISTRQIDRLTSLVENLLDVTSFRHGNFNLQLENVNLSDVVSDTVERFQVLFKERKCTLLLSIEPNIIGRCDKNRIEQVFVNLISNAFKYAPEKPVEISLQKKHHNICFIIKDHGPGIETAQLEKIFDRFERSNVDKNVSGLGLGLYIAKKIIEAHNGSIKVESELGSGSTFIVSLPC